MAKFIACSIDDNYQEQFFVFLTSLFENNSKKEFHIFILHETLGVEFKTKIDFFFKVKSTFTYSLIQLRDSLLDEALVFGHVSRATYFRLLLTKVIPNNVNEILYLDVDIIINQNIGKLLEISISNYSHLGVINLGIEDNYKVNLGLLNTSTYFNAGVMMINLAWWRNESIYERSLDFIKNNSEKIILWDQDVLNVVLENNWKEIPFKYNAQEQIFRDDMRNEYPVLNFLDSCYNPTIIHYTGGGHSKPWFKECRHALKNEYIYYYYKSRRFQVKTDKWLYLFGRDIKLNHLTVLFVLLQRMNRKLIHFFYKQKIKLFA